MGDVADLMMNFIVVRVMVERGRGGMVHDGWVRGGVDDSGGRRGDMNGQGGWMVHHSMTMVGWGECGWMVCDMVVMIFDDVTVQINHRVVCVGRV